MHKVVITVKSTTKGRVGAGTLSREVDGYAAEPAVETLRELRRESEKQYKELYGCQGTADITVRRY